MFNGSLLNSTNTLKVVFYSFYHCHNEETACEQKGFGLKFMAKAFFSFWDFWKDCTEVCREKIKRDLAFRPGIIKDYQLTTEEAPGPVEQEYQLWQSWWKENFQCWWCSLISTTWVKERVRKKERKLRLGGRPNRTAAKQLLASAIIEARYFSELLLVPSVRSSPPSLPIGARYFSETCISCHHWLYQ